jgi:hypothetical protein
MRSLILAAALLASACSAGSPAHTAPAGPQPVTFSAVDLPSGAQPVVLTPAGDDLLIGIRRPGQPLVPGLLRLSASGTTELPVHGASPYGQLATWQSIATSGGRLAALGGERGGAHGHVRWSLWSGSLADGLTEQVQGFSVFGGYEAGDLVDLVTTAAGPAVVGAWASANAGFDLAVWTYDGVDTWARRSSAGTALESTASSLPFPQAAAPLRDGVAIAGWRLAVDAGGQQLPVVWRSASGVDGWTSAELPDAGKAGEALAIRCWASSADGCAVAGRVDGVLAVWRLDGDAWSRVSGAPAVSVSDGEKLTAPVEVDGQLVQVIADGDQVKVARFTKDGWTVSPAKGPAGKVTAVTRIGRHLYVIAGPDDAPSLWRTEL